MKTPFCTLCLQSNVLCDFCDSKLSRGELTQLDIDLSNYLSENHDGLDAEYLSSFSSDKVLILFMRGDVGRVVGAGGKGAIKLSRLQNKRVKIINLGADLKSIISAILYPAKLVGVNTLFKDGSELSRVRVSRKESLRIPFDRKSLENVLAKVTAKKVRLVFE